MINMLDNAPLFVITTCTMSRESYGSEVQTLVVVKMPVKAWNKIKASGHLGHFYGAAIGNEVYALSGQLVQAFNPTVDDKQRASKGIKTIALYYTQPNSDRIKAAGLGREWGSALDLLKPRTRYLKLVTA